MKLPGVTKISALDHSMAVVASRPPTATTTDLPVRIRASGAQSPATIRTPAELHGANTTSPPTFDNTKVVLSPVAIVAATSVAAAAMNADPRLTACRVVHGGVPRHHSLAHPRPCFFVVAVVAVVGNTGHEVLQRAFTCKSWID